MKTERIYLSDAERVPYMDVYIPAKTLKRDIRRPFVLVCPGGGYFFCNSRETDQVALGFLSKGFNVAVLTYSTEDGDRYPKQLTEIAKAVSIIKEKAREWWSEPDRVYIAGFSAGGHLAASLGTLWNKEKAIAGIDCRPRGLILCYSVTVSGEFENTRTYDDLCGDDKELREWTSLEDKVDSETPPCFIWHTYEDALVPVENALLFAAALRRNEVPFELHVFQKGPHAMSLAEEWTSDSPDQESTHVQSWLGLAASWIRSDFGNM